jgi:molybdopterin-guanine dinucleotide biosynthesis protein MobB
MFEGRIIGVCGHKDTGKTRVVEGLVKFLKAKGHSVGTVKHVHGAITISPAAADSERHMAAGADCVVVESSDVNQISMRSRAGLRSTEAVEAAARYLFGCDYIIVEGFKRAEIPKIVATAQPGDVPEGLTQVVAYVGDGPKPEKAPGFKLSELDKLGTLLFDKQILAPVGPLAHLVVNGRPIAANEFVQSALWGVLTGFLSSLRDIGTPATIEISMKRRR